MSDQSTAPHNIMFSQVREDPTIEIKALKKINNKNHNRKRILLVGSGGCTLLSLLACSNCPVLIDVVDNNLDQLLLIQLKKAVCHSFEYKEDIIKFFQGEFSHHKYNRFMKKIIHSLSPNGKKYWIDKMYLIYSGINQCGIFEKLFVELIESEWNFDKVFNRNYLIDKFGENAVTNSMSREFSDHFCDVMKKYICKYTLENNYFYHQIVENKYNVNGNLPYYLSHFSQLKLHLQDNRYKIQTFLSDMSSFGIRPGEYDLIQTSNLTDWIPTHQLDSFIKEVSRGLKPDGIVIARRLNGDYSLKNIMNKYLDARDITKSDKSCFYSEVIEGTRRK